MVDPWTLRILVEVADRGSLSAAAEALVLSQPAVSRQIASLERHLGVPLFRRVPRGVVATPAGVTAVDLARSILARHEAFEATMKTFVGMAAGPLRLAGFASVNTWFLPEAIRRFRTAHPDVTVTLQQVGPLEVLDAVRRGDIDVALLTDWQLVASPLTARTDPDPVRIDPDGIDDLELVALLDEELHVALPASTGWLDGAWCPSQSCALSGGSTAPTPTASDPSASSAEHSARRRRSASSATTGTASRRSSPVVPA